MPPCSSSQGTEGSLREGSWARCPKGRKSSDQKDNSVLSLRPLGGKSPSFVTKPLRKTDWQNVCDTFKQAQCQPTGLLPPWHQIPDALCAHTLSLPGGSAGKASEASRVSAPVDGAVSGCGGLGEGSGRTQAPELQLTRLRYLLCSSSISLPSRDRTDVGLCRRGLQLQPDITVGGVLLNTAGLTGLCGEQGENHSFTAQDRPAPRRGPGRQMGRSHISSALVQPHPKAHGLLLS